MGGTFGKSGSWIVDHSMDNIPLSEMNNGDLRHGSIVTLTGGSPGSDDKTPVSMYESESERKSRRRSLFVAYMTMFVMSIGFSIVLTGVWPYMQTLSTEVDKSYIGWVIAANPLGQVLLSPVVGIWGNKAGGIRIPCIVTVIFFILGNAMYSILAVFDSLGGLATYYSMIVSRFIVGLSSANVTLTRSYVAGATTVKERTTGIAIIAAAQALGFVVGPVIQALVTSVIKETIQSNVDWLYLDKYTACGWVAAALGFINLVILMPCVFKEHNIAEKERAMMKEGNKDIKLPKPDYIGICGTLFGFFVSLFIFTLIETLAEPFVQDEYGWSEDKALIIVGIGLAAGGVLSVGMFVLSGYLAKKYDERKVILGLGFPLLVVGSFLAMPWGNGVMPRKCPEAPTNGTTMSTTAMTFFSTDSSTAIIDGADVMDILSNSTSDTTSDITSHISTWITGSITSEYPEDCHEHGCPYEEQTWCEYTPQLHLAQLGISYVIIILGYPVVQSLCQAIYSKMLGPKPQGLWMGVLTGVGGCSRILGPIFVSYVYTYLGPYYTFGILTGAMILAVIELLILYKRLVPMKIPSLEEMRGYDGPASDKY